MGDFSTELERLWNLGYYWQASVGHLDVMVSARPVSEVLTDPNVPEKSKEAIRYASEVRAFASEHLHLPDNESYTNYADWSPLRGVECGRTGAVAKAKAVVFCGSGLSCVPGFLR